MTSAERKMQEVEKEWIALENEEKRFLLNKKDTENKLEVLCLFFPYLSYHINQKAVYKRTLFNFLI